MEVKRASLLADFSLTFEAIFVREPSLLPVFGKQGVKAPAAGAVRARPAGIVPRLREVLVTHGGMALKLSVIAWTVMILAAVFFLIKG